MIHRGAIPILFASLVIVVSAGIVNMRVALRPRPTIVLISIDTLRADHLGAYGYAKSPSPFIDSVASRGTLFDDVVVPVPATDPSHSALLTGLHPVRTGVLSNSMPLRPEFETIAEALRNAGYATAAATGVYHLSARYGFDRGFERFSSVSDGQQRRSADAVNADAVRLIREHAADGSGRPLFLFVHYFDVHYPYVNHEDSLRFPGDRTLQSTIEAYDSGVRFVDAHIRSIWTALEETGLADNTILAITADHGEQLGEHGVIAGHLDLYAETIRTPLVIAGPGIVARRVPVTVSSMDLAPTILDLAGRRFRKPTDGRSVAGLLRGSMSIARPRPLVVLGYPHYARSLAVRKGSRYYIWNLEWVYQTCAVTPIGSGFQEGSAGAEQVAEMTVDRGHSVFTIPAIDFEPYHVTADVAIRTGCAVDLGVSLPSGVDLIRPVQVRASTRIEYSVARYDTSFITASASACVQGVTWSFEKLRAPEAPSANPLVTEAATTSLAATLAPSRKWSAADELYDIETDPMMTNNLFPSEGRSQVGMLKSEIEKGFAPYRQVTSAPFSLESDEIERLRSLGYIQ